MYKLFDLEIEVTKSFRLTNFQIFKIANLFKSPSEFISVKYPNIEAVEESAFI